jgi:hypothetical protein
LQVRLVRVEEEEEGEGEGRVYDVEGLLSGQTLIVVYEQTQSGTSTSTSVSNPSSYTNGATDELIVAPVPHNASQCNFWGKH